MLLLWCREAITTGNATPLSRALLFLHRELRPSCWYWPLVEAVRSLVLTGFLALVRPGSLSQLLLGLLAASIFFMLQVRRPLHADDMPTALIAC